MVEDVLLCLGECWIGSQLKERVGPDGEALGECGKEGVGSRFGCQGPILEDDSLSGCRYGKRFQDLATDGIEDDARALTGSDLVDAAHQVFLVGDDHMIHPLFEKLGLLSSGTGDGNAGSTLDLDHLNSSYAHAAAGRRDNDKVSFRYLPKPDECTVRG